MSVIRKEQPLCRFCGRPIRKITRSVSFTEDPRFARNHTFSMTLCVPADQRPKSIDECRRLTNERVVSVKWNVDYETKKRIDIYTFTTWDGETYADPYFCNNDHARLFAKAAAKADMAMPAYNEAIAKRDAEKDEN